MCCLIMVWLETLRVLACGDGTPYGAQGWGWFEHAGRTPRVNGEKAVPEPGRSLARKIGQQRTAKLGEKR